MFLKDSASWSVLMMLLLQSTVAGESSVTQGLKLSSSFKGCLETGRGCSILDLEGGSQLRPRPPGRMEALPPPPARQDVPLRSDSAV